MYPAFWHASSGDKENAISVQCHLKAEALTWDTPQGKARWAFEDLIFEAHATDTVAPKARGFNIRHRHQNEGYLSSLQYGLLNALLPHLMGAQRHQALSIYNNQRPDHGKRVLLGVLAGMVVMASILWLFFWGQIQLRKQQLALADPALNTKIETRHLQEVTNSFEECQSSEIESLLEDILQEHYSNTGSKNIRLIRIFKNNLPEALILSKGTLILSTTLVKDISSPALQALLAHEAGHLNLNHRLESRIYEQGNEIFYQLWSPKTNADYLLNAPLWVRYSRGQEAAADHWAFKSLRKENTADFKLLAKLWLAYEKSPEQQKGFVSRHPLATDRLQSLDQLPDLKQTPSDQNSMLKLRALQKSLENCG